MSKKGVLTKLEQLDDRFLQKIFINVDGRSKGELQMSEVRQGCRIRACGAGSWGTASCPAIQLIQCLRLPGRAARQRLSRREGGGPVLERGSCVASPGVLFCTPNRTHGCPIGFGDGRFASRQRKRARIVMCSSRNAADRCLFHVA
jgi:hypothetical protein